MTQPDSTTTGAPMAEKAFVQLVRSLTSTEAQTALVCVYACANLFHGAGASAAVMAARAGEAAAHSKMQRLVLASPEDHTEALTAAADEWCAWHSKKVAAEAEMETAITEVRTRLLAAIRASSSEENAEEAELNASEAPENETTAPQGTTEEPAAPTAPEFVAALRKPMSAAQKGAAPTKATRNKNSSADIAHSALQKRHTKAEAEAVKASRTATGGSDILTDEEVRPMADAASTRTPSSQDPLHPVEVEDSPTYPSHVPDAPLTSTCSVAFPKLTPPSIGVHNVQQAHEEARAKPARQLRQLCFEDYNLRFTQADFVVACEEVRRQCGDGGKGGGAIANVANGQPAALSVLAGNRPPPLDRAPPPPPRSVEDSALHYVRRQLSLVHLRPFASVMKALTVRLEEGETVSAAPHVLSNTERASDVLARLTDPLMLRLWTELREVCELHPVPRVHVRGDAQVYRKDRGYFKADEARVQLHVEVTPSGGPMAGEAIHVWVRVPAAYPFVAPRAHLTVELPHRRCTGVAVDKVPHLIALSYDDAALTSTLSKVCPTPLHSEEVARLQPLSAVMNSGWRPGLTLRHVLVALADLFNAAEFAVTAKELHNDNLMHRGLQNARVNMYEEDDGAEVAVVEAATGRPKAAEVLHTAASKRASATLLHSGDHHRASEDEDEEDGTGNDSMGTTASREEAVTPSCLLVCNGPFLVKPAVSANAVGPTASSTPTTEGCGEAAAAAASTAGATQPPSEFDVEDEGSSIHSLANSPSARNTANRRRPRRNLTYDEMDKDTLSGPWRGCWGHVLYTVGGSNASANVTAVASGPNTSVTSPIRAHPPTDVPLSAGNAVIAKQSLENPSDEGEAAPVPLQTFPSASSRPDTPPAASAHHSKSGDSNSSGSLYIRVKHFNPSAPAATIRLVHIPAAVLRDPSTVSTPSSPARRSKSRTAGQASWASAVLNTGKSCMPAGTVWSSPAPAEMEKEVLLRLYDGEGGDKDSPTELASTLPNQYQRQSVNLRELHGAPIGTATMSAHASSNATDKAHPANNTILSTHSANVSLVATPIVPAAMYTGNEANSVHTSESAMREDEAAGPERCYAILLEVPEGQEVSVIFSSDEAAALSMPWGTAAAAEAGTEVLDDHRLNAVMTQAQWNSEDTASDDKALRGVLVEVPYEEWQFHALPAASAAANGARRDEDVHPHWPHHARFHGSERVVPLALTEAAFRMYQVLQNSQMGSSSSVHAGSFLSAAAYPRVRQMSGGPNDAAVTSGDGSTVMATRGEREREATLRYGFWGWRNVLLPLLSSETQELVHVALLNAGAANTAKVFVTGLREWETTALEDFALACVQLHRSPDASIAYRPPFRSFAVLRTLVLAASYALEVLESLHTHGGQHADANRETPDHVAAVNKKTTGASAAPLAEETAALEAALHKVLWDVLVLAVATAAVKPAFLELCLALVDAFGGRATQKPLKELDVRQAQPREVQSAVSQLTALQRRVAQTLASSVLSAYPKDVKQVRRGTATASHTTAPSPATASARTTPLPSGAAEDDNSTNNGADSNETAASLVDRVNNLLNAPDTPKSTATSFEEQPLESRVLAFTKLIASVPR